MKASFLMNELIKFVFLGPHLKHMEVTGLGVKSELQLPAYTTVTAMPDLSRLCDLHCSSQQDRILNPLREARDQICVLMGTSWVNYHWAKMGTPTSHNFWDNLMAREDI